MNTHFDEAAKTWDNKPERIERAKKFAEEILRLTHHQNIQSAMEFGAGTGAVSFFLKDNLPSITMTDTSEGMIRVMTEKISSFKVNHIRALKIDLLKEFYHDKHDLIYTLMTLHHINDVTKIFDLFFTILNPGGILAIGDLITEDGSFHSGIDGFNGHSGFDVDQLQKTLLKYGFLNIQSKIFDQAIKIINGQEKIYPLFFLSAFKP